MNIPKLRFKEFSGEWGESKLGDIGSTNSGLTYSPNNVMDSNGHLVLRSSNIQNGMISYLDNVYVDCKINEKEIVRENDILLCARNGSKHLIGKSILINKEQDGFAFGAFMAVYRSESNQLVSQFFKSSKFYKQVHQHLGATINQITGKSLNSFKLFLPQKQEQQKIASFLTSIDTKIEQLNKKQQLLEEYKKAIMQKIFSQEIRFGCNKDWEIKKLRELVIFENGKAHENNIDKNGKYIVVNSKFVSSNGKVKKYSNLEITPLNKDDIVMVMSDVPNGKALAKCFYIEKDNKYTLNQRICSLKQKKSINKFLFYIINRNKYYLSFDSGVGQTNLRKDEVLNLKLSIPSSLKEQTKIANFLSSCDKKIEFVSNQLGQTKEFKKGLLQKMFV